MEIGTKILAYTTLVRPILEYGAKCWDPCREGQINGLDRVQTKAAQLSGLTRVERAVKNTTI